MGKLKTYTVWYHNVDAHGNVDPHLEKTTVTATSKIKANWALERQYNYKIVVDKVVVGGI